MRNSRICAALALLVMIATIALANDESRFKVDRRQPKSVSQTKPLVGVGTALISHASGARIQLVLPNRPAALSDELKANDVIVAVAQGDHTPVDVRGVALGEIVDLIRGPAGTEVRLTIVPADDQFVKQKVVSLIRMPLQRSRLVGKRVPLVPFEHLSDDRKQSLAGFLGKVVVLEFWTTSCAPCMKHVGTMQAFRNTKPAWGDRVALITVSLDDRKEEPADVIRTRGWNKTLNFWGDEKSKKAFDAEIIPMVLLIDDKGTVIASGDPRFMNVPKIVDGLLAQ